jgi:hypothetical protein
VSSTSTFALVERSKTLSNPSGPRRTRQVAERTRLARTLQVRLADRFLSPADLDADLEREHMTVADLRRDLERQMIVSRLRLQVAAWSCFVDDLRASAAIE